MTIEDIANLVEIQVPKKRGRNKIDKQIHRIKRVIIYNFNFATNPNEKF
jgi:hypothetical protein